MDKGSQIHNSQSSSICNRLFNLIFNTIWVTMGNQIPIESPHTKNMNGDIEIEFRHMEIVGPKKSVIIEETTQKRNETKQIPLSPAPAPRQRHLINVTSNINEKTEAFIKSKKEALRKSYNNETDKKI